ncbi:MAG: hypothetical protein E6Q50_03035 [Lysobacter sp.]|nr:MAG: hypothetical protein E6Q50_03035 [Lysobacter sp.]
MSFHRNLLFRSTMLCVCSAIVATGCLLDRRPLANWPKLEPALFCPGDTVTASYDFLTPETCPADASCSSFFPTVRMNSTPTAFPARTTTNFVDSVTFTPPGDSVTVAFDIDRDTVTVPTARFDGGTRIFVARTQLVDATRVTRRLIGTDNQVLPHPGECAGGIANYSPIEVPGFPRLSTRVRLEEFSNENSFPVRYIVSGSVPGEVFDSMLMPGQRVLTTMPGVPASIAEARSIEAIPLIAQMCTPGSGATDPEPQPPPLRTGVRMGCR